MSTANHPQTDGQAERSNQTIEQMLRCCILGNEEVWGELLPIMEFAYNSRVHSSTKSAPFELLYGFVPTPPICHELGIGGKVALQMLPVRANVLLEKAKHELQQAQEYQKRYADKRRRPVDFKAGDRVWLSTHNLPDTGASTAFKDRFTGPYEILEMIGTNAARLNLPKSLLVHPVFHVSLLRPVTPEAPDFRRPPPRQRPLKENEYTLEAILDHRWSARDKRRTFQVQWADASTSWEPKNIWKAPNVYLNGICAE